jgi:serine/threonine protein kinase
MRSEVPDSNRFSFLQTLGSGAWGDVLLVEDQLSSRQVAMKTVKDMSAEAVLSLKRDFRSVVDLRHVNLVEHYELNTETHPPYVLMEHISGDTLAARAHDEAGVRLLLKGIAEGLDHIHKHGVIHGDIKPTNVMLTAEGVLKLLDFGLSSDNSRSITERTVSGTFNYLAPELLSGSSPSIESDWYATGVMLVELILGAELVFDEVSKLKFRGPSEEMQASLGSFGDIGQFLLHLLSVNPKERIEQELFSRCTGIEPLSDSASRFVGRNEELALLESEFSKIDQGARIAVLRGDSGMGKTALVREFLKRTDTDFLSSQCRFQEAIGFNAVDQLIDGLSDHGVLNESSPNLIRMFLGSVDGPERPANHDPELKFRAAEELRVVFANLSMKQNLVVWIDDLQWADQDSLDFLFDGLRDIHASNILFIFCLREKVAGLSSAVQFVQKLQLPVSEAEIGRLSSIDAHQMLGIEKSATLVSELEGNTFLLDQARELAGRPEELSRDSLLESRLNTLGDSELAILSLLTISSEQLSTEDIVTILQNDELRFILSGLGALGYVRAYRVADTYLFELFHNIWREAVLARLSDAEAATMHRRVVEYLLTKDTVNQGALFHHFRELGDTPQAASYGERAALEAYETGAYLRSAQLYKEVDDLTEQSRHRSTRARALGLGGYNSEAMRLYESLADETPITENKVENLRKACDHALFSGDLDSSLRYLRELAQVYDVKIPNSPTLIAIQSVILRLPLLLRQVDRKETWDNTRSDRELEMLRSVSISMSTIDHKIADVITLRYVGRALKSGNRTETIHALMIEAANESNIGGSLPMLGGRFERRSREMVQLATDLAIDSNAEDRAHVECVACGVKLFLGDLEDAIEHGERGLSLYQSIEQEYHWDVATVQHYQLQAIQNRGDIPLLRSKVDHFLRQASIRGDKHARNLLMNGAFLLFLVDDNPKRVWREAEGFLEIEVESYTTPHLATVSIVASTLMYEGKYDQCWDYLELHWPSLQRAGFMMLDWVRSGLVFLKARAAMHKLSISDDAAASNFLSSSEKLLKRSILPSSKAYLHLIRSLDAQRNSDRERCVRELSLATSEFSHCGMLLLSDLCKYQTGVLMQSTDIPSIPINERGALMREDAIKRLAQFYSPLYPGFFSDIS